MKGETLSSEIRRIHRYGLTGMFRGDNGRTMVTGENQVTQVTGREHWVEYWSSITRKFLVETA